MLRFLQTYQLTDRYQYLHCSPLYIMHQETIIYSQTPKLNNIYF